MPNSAKLSNDTQITEIAMQEKSHRTFLETALVHHASGPEMHPDYCKKQLALVADT